MYCEVKWFIETNWKMFFFPLSSHWLIEKKIYFVNIVFEVIFFLIALVQSDWFFFYIWTVISLEGSPLHFTDCKKFQRKEKKKKPTNFKTEIPKPNRIRFYRCKPFILSPFGVQCQQSSLGCNWCLRQNLTVDFMSASNTVVQGIKFRKRRKKREPVVVHLHWMGKDKMIFDMLSERDRGREREGRKRQIYIFHWPHHRIFGLSLFVSISCSLGILAPILLLQ